MSIDEIDACSPLERFFSSHSALSPRADTCINLWLTLKIELLTYDITKYIVIP